MIFSIVMEFGNNHHNLSLELHPDPKREPLPPPTVTPRSPASPLSQPQAITNLLSVAVDLPIIDPLHKWNHTIYRLSYLAFT